MSLKRILLFCSLIALSLSGCEKDNETGTPATTLTQKLTANPWHITSWTRTDNGGAPRDLMPTAACERDDRFTFSTNGTLSHTEGPTSCNGGPSTQAVEQPRPWSFNADQTILNIGAAGMGTSNTPYKIVQLTGDVMQLSYTRTSSGHNLIDNIRYEN